MWAWMRVCDKMLTYLKAGKDNVSVFDLKFDGQDYAIIREGEVEKTNVGAGLYVASWAGNHNGSERIPEVKFRI